MNYLTFIFHSLCPSCLFHVFLRLMPRSNLSLGLQSCDSAIRQNRAYLFCLGDKCYPNTAVGYSRHPDESQSHATMNSSRRTIISHEALQMRRCEYCANRPRRGGPAESHSYKPKTASHECDSGRSHACDNVTTEPQYYIPHFRKTRFAVVRILSRPTCSAMLTCALD
jgi:hypothetical protein